MKKLYHSFFLSFLFFILSQTACFSQENKEPLSERLANYAMNVKLDVESRLLDGSEIVTWKNNTSHATSELHFHLYYNAWYNTNSSFINSARGRLKSSTIKGYKENDWAYCNVESITILEKDKWSFTDVSETMRFIQPDDDNKEDRTVMKVDLPKPVNPGESISLEIKWQTKVPRPFSRTGVRGDYYFMAQWFPKIGVFEENGQWNCHQFISTEFYADFGIYDVRMTVPENWLLGATGSEIEKTENADGTLTYRYYQEDVHDFAWLTTPHMTEHYDTFDEPGLPKVKLKLILMSDKKYLKERYFASAKSALKYYGSWWGAYPYEHMTVVDPAYMSKSGGMEYPTFLTGGGRWLSPFAARSPESVTIHEVGHQFWYGIIANNEFEYAWLDEGFDTYSTTRTMEAVYSERVLVKRYFERFLPYVFSDIPRTERTKSAPYYAGENSQLKKDEISIPSWQYGPDAYGTNSYGKPAMMLRMLENYLGWETFQKIMSTYFERWKFKHPKPDDFFVIVNEISGKDMTWYFEQTYNSSNIFDYAVGEIICKKVATLKGYNKDLVFTESKTKKTDSDSSDIYTSTVFVKRLGEAVFPVDIKITFSNGEEIVEKWDGKRRWSRFDYIKKAEVTRVEIDPEHVLVLDINASNNSWVKDSKEEIASIKWTSKWMIWMQSLMEFFALFA